jgi:hypothetical protein
MTAFPLGMAGNSGGYPAAGEGTAPDEKSAAITALPELSKQVNAAGTIITID